jgi:hypothetical protein
MDRAIAIPKQGVFENGFRKEFLRFGLATHYSAISYKTQSLSNAVRR